MEVKLSTAELRHLLTAEIRYHLIFTIKQRLTMNGWIMIVEGRQRKRNFPIKRRFFIRGSHGLWANRKWNINIYFVSFRRLQYLHWCLISMAMALQIHVQKLTHPMIPSLKNWIELNIMWIGWGYESVTKTSQQFNGNIVCKTHLSHFAKSDYLFDSSDALMNDVKSKINRECNTIKSLMGITSNL